MKLDRVVTGLFGVQVTLWVLLVAGFVVFTVQGHAGPAILNGFGACFVGYTMAVNSTDVAS